MAFQTSLIVLMFCSVLYVHATTESTAVTGTLYCKQKTFKGFELKLVDYYHFSKDVVMDDQFTDKNGDYSLAGYNDPSLGRGIDPKVKIYHTCGSTSILCHEFSVPKEYISKGKDPKSTYHAPNLELSLVSDDGC